MKPTLILGNGISRRPHRDRIEQYGGEVWGCNWAFQEFPQKLSRLTGHSSILLQAQFFQEDYNCPWEIWGDPKYGFKPFTCPAEFRTDSGTTFVAQALEEGREIICCGFDLGGPEYYFPHDPLVRKDYWVGRWRRIAKHYDPKLERVTFWGYDHKPFLLSEESETKYWNRLEQNIPHIPTREYIEIWMEEVAMRKRDKSKAVEDFKTRLRWAGVGEGEMDRKVAEFEADLEARANRDEEIQGQLKGIHAKSTIA